MTAPIECATDRQDRLYARAAAEYAPAIARLARAVERNPDRSRDLEQDIHLALWRSFAGFAERCTLSTWVYRIAHNVAASHAMRGARCPPGVALEDVAELPAANDAEADAGTAQLLARITALIVALKQPDGASCSSILKGSTPSR